jgi:hypothetical protein
MAHQVIKSSDDFMTIAVVEKRQWRFCQGTMSVSFFGTAVERQHVAIDERVRDRHVGIGQGLRGLDSRRLRLQYRTVDFRALRRGTCAAGGAYVALRRFGNCRG